MNHKLPIFASLLLCFITCSSLHAKSQDFKNGYLDPMIEEKNVLIGNRMPGIVSFPKNTDPHKTQFPAVLLLHGFSSHKNEVGNFYQRLARNLAKNGFISLRMDFSGWGDSREPMEGSNLVNMLNDAKMGYEFLQTDNHVNSSKISICGFNLGAYIGFRLAQAQKDSLTLIMLSPAGDPAMDLKRYLHLSSLDPSTKKEQNTFDLGWRKVSLGRSFFSSLLDSPPIDRLGRINVPILAISANEDFSHQYMAVINKASNKDNISISLQNSDHIFGMNSAHDQSGIVLTFVTGWLTNKVSSNDIH